MSEFPWWTPDKAPECHAWDAPAEPYRGVREDDVLAYAQAWQAGRCAICGEGGGGRLVCDHDHWTGLFRGFLCRSCNSREPHTRSRSFDDYRERPPAVILGVTTTYRDPEQFVPLPGRVPRDPAAAAAFYVEAWAQFPALKAAHDEALGEEIERMLRARSR